MKFIFLCAFFVSQFASAGPIWDCARRLVPDSIRPMIDIEFAKLESRPLLRKLHQKVRHQRWRFGITTVAKISHLRSGQIAVVTGTNCAPSLNVTLRLNALLRRYPEWEVIGHDFKVNWNSDDGQIPSVIVVGESRRVQFGVGGFGESFGWVRQQLDAAVRLASEPGHDLIWSAHQPMIGRWIEARTTPARDMYSELKP